MEVNYIAVMRRISDSWLNATQVLNAAGIIKEQQDKIIEREIIIGDHNKVQSGCGKYQEVWINYERGVELCQEYGLEELLRPLLNYNIDQDRVSLAERGTQTPRKEQVMVAQRRRAYSAPTIFHSATSSQGDLASGRPEILPKLVHNSGQKHPIPSSALKFYVRRHSESNPKANSWSGTQRYASFFGKTEINHGDFSDLDGTLNKTDVIKWL